MRSQNKASLRKQVRQKRRSLTPQQQKQAAVRLKRVVVRHPLFLRSKHIAFYLANDGEIDPGPLMNAALKMGKHCYLPALHLSRNGFLWFVRYRANDKLKKNKFGIPEPLTASHRLRNPYAIDLVLTPLVAFDVHGTRMGMGGGYYDRTFADIKLGRKSKPILLGLAHECQKVDKLDQDEWDVPLVGVATDAQFYS